MKITTFNPVITTSNAEDTIKLFEELGFERRHVKNDIGDDSVTNVRMKDPNGFHVDITEAKESYTMIRMNVDNLEEATNLMLSHGFHIARHPAADKTVDTGTSRYNILVSPTGAIFAVSEHTK